MSKPGIKCPGQTEAVGVAVVGVVLLAVCRQKRRIAVSTQNVGLPSLAKNAKRQIAVSSENRLIAVSSQNVGLPSICSQNVGLPSLAKTSDCQNVGVEAKCLLR